MKKLIPPLLILTATTFAFSATSSGTKTSPKMTSKVGVSHSDSEIVNMLMTINTEEMNLSKLGKNQAKDPKIKEYANKMFTAHAKNNDRAALLRREQNIKLTETKSSNKMKIKVESTIEDLQNKEGENFDKAYMEAQMVVHQKALRKLEETLIPNAKDNKLKAMLEETKKHVESHLKEAQSIQTITL